MSSLRYSIYTIADVECQNVSVEQTVGRYRMLFELNFVPMSWNDGQSRGYVPSLTSLRLVVKLNNTVVGTAFPEGEDFLPPVHPGILNAVPVPRSFALDVDRYTLDKIEQERKGQGIAFDLEILGTSLYLGLWS